MLDDPRQGPLYLSACPSRPDRPAALSKRRSCSRSTSICFRSLADAAQFSFFSEVVREGCGLVEVDQVQRALEDYSGVGHC